jgi:uncharacterized protein (TIGR02444 family)
VADSKSLEDDFWDYACTIYAGDGVSPAMLDWQARVGANVNTVLLCLWAGYRGRGLTSADFHRLGGAIAGWHAATIVPLRRLRERLKEDWADLAPMAAVTRQAVLAAELQAERAEQAAMIRALAPWTVMPVAAEAGLARCNLLAYLGRDEAAAIDRLLARIG